MAYRFHGPNQEMAKTNSMQLYNSHVRIANEFFFESKMYEKGVIYVKDIAPEGTIYTYVQYCQVYGGESVDFLRYASIISAIPTAWKKLLRNETEASELEFPSKYSVLCQTQKWSQKVYSALLKDEHGVLQRLANAWTQKLNTFVDSEQVQKALVAINEITHIVKYRSFQFKLIHNAVLVNDRLVHIGVVEDSRCSFCKMAKDSIRHHMIDCPITNEVWVKIQDYAKQKLDIEMDLNPVKIIFNISNDEISAEHLLILLVKQQIFAAKCMNRKPSTTVICKEFEFIQNLEYKQAMLTNAKRKKYNRRWPVHLKLCEKEQDYIKDYVHNM